jgi:hypothetical protein
MKNRQRLVQKIKEWISKLIYAITCIVVFAIGVVLAIVTVNAIV